jgi:hypothetical protein
MVGSITFRLAIPDHPAPTSSLPLSISTRPESTPGTLTTSPSTSPDLMRLSRRPEAEIFSSALMSTRLSPRPSKSIVAQKAACANNQPHLCFRQHAHQEVWYRSRFRCRPKVSLIKVIALTISYLQLATRRIAEVSTSSKIVVEKSTVPCRTAE